VKSAVSTKKKASARRRSAVTVPRRSTEEIRARLIHAAGVEFRKYGFAGATTAEIARRANTTEAQLFRAFKSKGDLFREAVFEPLNRHLSGFLERYLSEVGKAPNAREQARLYIQELQEFIDQNSTLLLSLIAAQSFDPDNAAPHGTDNLQNYFKLGAGVMKKRLVGPPAVDPDILVRVSFAAVMGCVMFKDWMFPDRSPKDAAAISAGIIAFVIDGINVNFDPEMRSPGK
jgi:AcrR family transcriptional regulator